MPRPRGPLGALSAGAGVVLSVAGLVAEASPAADAPPVSDAPATVTTADRGADERLGGYAHIYAWFAGLHRYDIDGWSPPVLDVGGIKLRVWLDGFNPELNVGTAFVDITDLPLQVFNPEHVIDVEWLREHRPDLYEQMDVDATVEHVWALSRISASATAREEIWRRAGLEGKPRKNWLHGESAFLRALSLKTEQLRNMGALKPKDALVDRVYATFSERDNCRGCSHDLRSMRSRPKRLSLEPLGGGDVTERMKRQLASLDGIVGRAFLHAGDGPVLPPPSIPEGSDGGEGEVGGPCPGASRSWSRPALTQVVTSGCEDAEASEESEASNGLVEGLATSSPAPGGVDFSSLELRYVAEGADSGRGMRYAFAAGRFGGRGRNLRAEGVEAARLSSNAFFVWLSLPSSTFTVNLNPHEPDNIMDERLGRTDVGRVLLEADLQMKRTTGDLTDPRTPLGKRYWREIKGDCVSGRTWIVPGPAKVRDTGDELYIIDAPLRIKTEAAYLAERGQSRPAAACPHQSRAASIHNARVARRLIIPRLEHAVNNAPEYADLRRVYLARVAAEWYRERSETEDTAYGHLIDQGDIGDWETRTGWRPIDTYREYLESYRHGEYKVTDRVEANGKVYRRTLWYGGIALQDVSLDDLTRAEAAATWPEFEAQIQASFRRPASGGPVPGSTLLGGEIPYRPAEQRPVDSRADTSRWVWLAAPPIGVLLLLGLVLAHRRTEARR